MPPRLSALLLAVALALPAATAPAPPREVDNVAAFARLYGVLRFFYPGDTAAELDWNRFAVHGVARVRPARDPAELAAALRVLVAPLGPGIAVGPSLPAAPPAEPANEPLVAWRYLGPGFSTGGGAYSAKRTHRAAPVSTEGFATVMQTLPAEGWRGRAIRLRGQVRAPAVGPGGGAALWLRVDRAGGMGFFDNMSDRMVVDGEWRECTIEGTVADDAEAIAFGVMAVGAVTADFDAVELAAKDDAGDWVALPVGDAGFEATSANDSAWQPAGSRPGPLARPTDGAPQGAQFLRIGGASAAPSDDELFPEGAPRPGAHADVELGSGLWARVPLALTDAAARPAPSRAAVVDRLRSELAAVPGPSEAPDVDARLADVVVAWSVFRHFYPYWTEAGVDWDGRLVPNLEAAFAAESRDAQRDALRRLVVDVRDGHGFVADTLQKTENGELPIGLAVVEGRIVVAASALPEAPVGAVVTSIDGVPAADRLAAEIALASGTAQWRDEKALWGITGGAKGTSTRLGLDAGQGPREVSLEFGAERPPVPRPEPVSELEPGLWYVDLTRAKMPDVAPKLEAIAAARGVVFDVRGYPTDAGFGILRHLLDAPESDRWMHVAKIVGPFYETAGWLDVGWDLKPAPPRIAGKVVFLTHGGAISYAESVMGYVADRELGTIVGSTTAGTNGNVATFVTPGGFTLGFTGMRVTRHDGHSVHHLVGVRPDVAVAPTIAGLRAGRDEVLERGIAVLKEGEGPASP